MLVEIVDDDLRVAVALEFNDHAGVLGRLIAHIADTGEDFFSNEFGDAFHQLGAVHIEGDFGDDDRFAAAFSFLNADAPTDAHGAAAGLEVGLDAVRALDEAAGGEIRTLHVNHEPFDGDVGVVDLGADGINALAEIVRRHVRGHADGDARAAVDEEIRERGGENGRFLAFLVVGRHEIDCAEIHIGHQRGAEVV